MNNNSKQIQRCSVLSGGGEIRKVARLSFHCPALVNVGGPFLLTLLNRPVSFNSNNLFAFSISTRVNVITRVVDFISSTSSTSAHWFCTSSHANIHDCANSGRLFSLTVTIEKPNIFGTSR